MSFLYYTVMCCGLLHLPLRAKIINNSINERLMNNETTNKKDCRGVGVLADNVIFVGLRGKRRNVKRKDVGAS